VPTLVRERGNLLMQKHSPKSHSSASTTMTIDRGSPRVAQRNGVARRVPSMWQVKEFPATGYDFVAVFIACMTWGPGRLLRTSGVLAEDALDDR